jgi:phosphocarrier protein
MPDVRRTVVVGSRVGLHSRPAKLVAQEATKLSVIVKISKDNGAAIDARSLLSILALGAKKGDQVTLSAEGEGADDAIQVLSDLIERDLDEADV